MPGDSNRPRLETNNWSGLRLNYARTHKLPQILSKWGSPSKANSSARRPVSASSANRKTVFRKARSFCPMNSPSSTKPWIPDALLSLVEVGANDGHRTPRGSGNGRAPASIRFACKLSPLRDSGFFQLGFDPANLPS